MRRQIRVLGYLVVVSTLTQLFPMGSVHASSHPVPIVSIDAPNYYEMGEPFTIRVSMENDNYPASSISESWLDISFPDDPVLDITNSSSSWTVPPRLYETGDEIYDKNGNPFDADYPLISAKREGSWHHGTERFIEVKVTPPTTGEKITILYRGTMIDGVDETRDPDSPPSSQDFTEDQQGFYVYEHVVTESIPASEVDDIDFHPPKRTEWLISNPLPLELDVSIFAGRPGALAVTLDDGQSSSEPIGCREVNRSGDYSFETTLTSITTGEHDYEVTALFYEDESCSSLPSNQSVPSRSETYTVDWISGESVIQYVNVLPDTDRFGTVTEEYDFRVEVGLEANTWGALQSEIWLEDDFRTYYCVPVLETAGETRQIDMAFTEWTAGAYNYDILTRFRPNGSCPLTETSGIDDVEFSNTYSVFWNYPYRPNEIYNSLIGPGTTHDINSPSEDVIISVTLEEPLPGHPGQSSLHVTYRARDGYPGSPGEKFVDARVDKGAMSLAFPETINLDYDKVQMWWNFEDGTSERAFLDGNGDDFITLVTDQLVPEAVDKGFPNAKLIGPANALAFFLDLESAIQCKQDLEDPDNPINDSGFGQHALYDVVTAAWQSGPFRREGVEIIYPVELEIIYPVDLSRTQVEQILLEQPITLHTIHDVIVTYHTYQGPDPDDYSALPIREEDYELLAEDLGGVWTTPSEPSVSAEAGKDVVLVDSNIGWYGTGEIDGLGTEHVGHEVEVQARLVDAPALLISPPKASSAIEIVFRLTDPSYTFHNGFFAVALPEAIDTEPEFPRALADFVDPTVPSHYLFLDELDPCNVIDSILGVIPYVEWGVLGLKILGLLQDEGPTPPYLTTELAWDTSHDLTGVAWRHMGTFESSRPSMVTVTIPIRQNKEEVLAAIQDDGMAIYLNPELAQKDDNQCFNLFGCARSFEVVIGHISPPSVDAIDFDQPASTIPTVGEPLPVEFYVDLTTGESGALSLDINSQPIECREGVGGGTQVFQAMLSSNNPGPVNYEVTATFYPSASCTSLPSPSFPNHSETYTVDWVYPTSSVDDMTFQPQSTAYGNVGEALSVQIEVEINAGETGALDVVFDSAPLECLDLTSAGTYTFQTTLSSTIVRQVDYPVEATFYPAALCSELPILGSYPHQADTYSVIWTIDTTPPDNPLILRSPSHTENQISSNYVITADWSGDAADNDSGVAGYSISWTENGIDEPDTTSDVAADVYTIDSEPLDDGTWWFNLRTCDNAGNCAETINLGPFIIDGNRPAIIPDNPSPEDELTDVSIDVDLNWVGGDPDDDGVTYTVFLAAGDSDPDVPVCEDLPSESCDPGLLSYNTTFYWKVVADDGVNPPVESEVWEFSTESAPVVGPLVYEAHVVDDDTTGTSSGNNNGIAQCGETIELWIDLRNEGDDPATGVNVFITEDSPYTEWKINASSTYPDIPGGADGTNNDDFDLIIDPTTPDGHVVRFALDITADNGGPWSTSFALTVDCDGIILINEVTPSGADKVELYNPGTTPVDLTGWQFTPYSGTGNPYFTYTFPTFTLQPGAFVVLEEGGSATNNTSSVLYMSGGIAWNANAPGAAALVDPSGSGVDFVRWGGSTVDPPAGTAWSGTEPGGIPNNQSLGRDDQSTDSDLGEDWSFQLPTFGAQNQVLSVVVGPLVYAGHILNDDENGTSSGNSDGIAQCGETIELWIDLHNQGTAVASGVSLSITDNSDDVTWLDNTTSAYPTLPGGGVDDNYIDFDFAIEPTMPHGTVVQFDLEITADNGGSWTENFSITIDCYGPIVINEVTPSGADKVELYNPGTTPVDLTDWQFTPYSGTGNPYFTYTFPTFTLQPGALVVLEEGGSATNNTSSILYMGNGIAWNATAPGAAALVDPSGSGVDFVRWGGSSLDPPAGTAWSGTEPGGIPNNQSLGRDDQSNDTDRGEDWSVQTATFGSQNQVVPEVVGPLVYAGHILNDDENGTSSGNSDGIAQCGETIELWIDLHNQGTAVASGVSLSISDDSADVTWVDNVSSVYPAISAGGVEDNYIDFDFAINPATPNETVVQFDLDITADNGGTWSDSFVVTVYCLDAIVINEVTPNGADSTELYNPNDFAVDLTGWQYKPYNDTGTPFFTYTLPSFTLEPGAYVILQEGGSAASNTQSRLYMEGATSWNPDSPGAAALIDPSGSGVDFVRWGSSTVDPPAGTAWSGTDPEGIPNNQSLGRDVQSKDTDRGEDWSPQVSSFGSQNPGSGPVVGPLAYVGHVLDDDNSETSSGNNDGIAQCGETIELWIDLQNQGTLIAGGVSLSISDNSTDVIWVSNVTSSYPTIFAGGVEDNDFDFDFAIDPATPNGTVVQFDLDITADSGGPWSDSFSITVYCYDAIVINEVTPNGADSTELYNPNDFAVDLTGWQFKPYDDNGTPFFAYTFPSFTLEPDSYVILQEGGSAASNTQSRLYMEGATFWNPDSPGAAALIDPSGSGVDFVRWGGSTVGAPSGTEWTGTEPGEIANNQSLGRDSLGTDTDHGEDWTPQIPSFGSQNDPGVACDTHEPDNTSGQATIITPGVPQNRCIDPAHDVDWATFTVPETSAVVVETSGPRGNTQMWLYNSSFEEVEFDDNDGSILFSFIDRTCGVDALPPGIYYVKVDEYYNDHVIPEYTLSVDVVECNAPPISPHTPNPDTDAMNISIAPELNWSGGDSDGDTVLYDVYLEAGDPTPEAIVCDSVSTESCSLPLLEPDTTYFWKVTANDGVYPPVESATWEFTTIPAPRLAPNSLTPTSETPDANWIFSILYTHSLDVAPESISLVLNGVTYPLTTADDTYDDGSIFVSQPIQLGEGLQLFYYIAETQGVSVRWPETSDASYITTCYQLTIGSTGEGSVPTAAPSNSPGCPTGSYFAEETIELIGAEAAGGWTIGGWVGTATDSSTETTNSVNMPASPHTASVFYSQNEPPHQPSNPSPADQERDVALDMELAWSGGDPDGDSVTYDVALEKNNSDPVTLVCDDVTLESCVLPYLDSGSTYYWRVIADDGINPPVQSAVWRFTTKVADVGPFVYVAHEVDDDDSEQSSGNGDGIVQCGETFELWIDIRNQGSDVARYVDITMIVSSPYAHRNYANYSDYPDIVGGGIGRNLDDFEIEVYPSAPDGYQLPLEIWMSASGTGAWIETIYIPVSCPRDIVINEVSPEPRDAVEIFNAGNIAVDMTGWQLLNYRELNDNGPYRSYTIPDFTLQPGAYVTIYESSGNDTTTELYTNDDLWWGVDVAGAAALINNVGTGVDFVRWGGSTDSSPERHELVWNRSGRNPNWIVTGT